VEKIDVLAYKTNSYDTQSFIEDILSYSPNSILLVSDFEKITVRYAPDNIEFTNKEIRFCRTRFQKFNYYISPLLLIIDMLIFFKLFFTLGYKYRPRICWMENTYVALVVGIMRRLGLCEKSIYVPGDWVAVKGVKARLLSRLANNFVFPMLDYLACKLNDVVLNHTERIAQARDEWWGRKIAKKEKFYSYRLQIKTHNLTGDKKGKAICFIGDMRKDSGLDIAIKFLPELRRNQDFTMKILGPQRQYYEYFKNLSTQSGMDKYVEFLGYVAGEGFDEVLSDCFCGISLITSVNSYSAYTISGKLIHYLQYLLPVIVTEGAGAFVPVIRGNNLGVVIAPTQADFVKGVFKVYEEQKQYRENIIGYIRSLPKLDIKDLLED